MVRRSALYGAPIQYRSARGRTPYCMYITPLPPVALVIHVSKRAGAGLLRSTRRELMAMIVAAAAFLLTSDFFSMCMTLLFVEDVSPTAFTY
jgi:hypothetical protein